MKAMRKILAVALVVVMMMALVVTASAAEGDKTITLKNGAKGKTYTLYKFLDAKIEDDVTFYTTTNATMAGSMKTGAADIFDVVGPDASGVYGVAVKSGKDNAAKDWFTTNAMTDANKADTWEADGGEKVWTVAPGYYCVTTGETDTVLTITQNTDNQVIYDKNDYQPVTPVDPDPDDPTTNGSKTVQETTASVGDTLHYTVKFTATNFNGAGADAKKITKYIITDTPVGVTLNSDIVVKVGGTQIEAAGAFNSENKLVLDWVDTDNKSLYDSGVEVVITYSGVVNKNALTEGAKNSAEIDFEDVDGEVTPINPDDEEPVVTKTCSFTLNKVDNTAEAKPLTGAKFKLYDAETAGNEIKVVKTDDGAYRVAEATEEASAVEIEAGTAVVSGLEAGNYWLEETQAPLGYNLLTARVVVNVTADGTNEISVQNSTGATLPTTGGFGTTMLLTSGVILFGTMAIVLVTKKRLYNEGM